MWCIFFELPFPCVDAVQPKRAFLPELHMKSLLSWPFSFPTNRKFLSLSLVGLVSFHFQSCIVSTSPVGVPLQPMFFGCFAQFFRQPSIVWWKGSLDFDFGPQNQTGIPRCLAVRGHDMFSGSPRLPVLRKSGSMSIITCCALRHLPVGPGASILNIFRPLISST